MDQSIRDRRKRGYFDDHDNKIGSRHRGLTPSRLNALKYDGPPMIDTKEFKQTFLKGDRDALYYCDRNEAKHTSYQANLTGTQVSMPATILDHNRTSLVGLVIPDPAMMTASNLKFKSLEQDRMRMSKRIFQQSGLVSVSPRN